MLNEGRPCLSVHGNPANMFCFCSAPADSCCDVLCCAMLCCWQVRRLGLKCALSAKANEGRLILVDSLTPFTPKTKFMAVKLQALLDSQEANSLSSAFSVMRSAEEAGCSSLVSRQRLLADAQARGVTGQEQQQQEEHQEQQQLAAGSDQELDIASLLQQKQQPDTPQQPEQQQPNQQQQEKPGSVQEGKAAGVVGPRLSAVIIDSAKDGDDGGALMRRTVRNLPGERCCVVQRAGREQALCVLSWLCEMHVRDGCASQFGRHMLPGESIHVRYFPSNHMG